MAYIGEMKRLGKAVTDYEHAMFERLFEKMDEGKTGWARKEWQQLIAQDMCQDAETVYLKFKNGLCGESREQLLKLLVDIGNRAMMLYTQVKKGLG